MSYRAVLFDVGGPIDTEESAEVYVDEQIKRLLRESGIAVSDNEYAEAARWAVESFAPATYRAIAWKLSGGRVDLVAKLNAYAFPERVFELRPGIDRVINWASASGLKLGLAANQPTKVLGELDRHGVGRFFSHREVSGHHGYHKPDVRLFLRACEDLRVRPQETIMVGDRIDNDIVPARVLGMATMLFRTGRHIEQQPRSADEVPDVEVWSADELLAALKRMAG